MFIDTNIVLGAVSAAAVVIWYMYEEIKKHKKVVREYEEHFGRILGK